MSRRFSRKISLLLIVGLAIEPAWARTPSPFAVDSEPTRPRSDLVMPAFSFLLPGLDQWWEGQYAYGGIYTGVALGGVTYAMTIAAAHAEAAAEEDVEAGGVDQTGNEEEDDSPIDEKDVTLRKVTLGLLAYQGSGGMSAYHSFRTAVRTRKSRGQYEFLAKEESPGEVMLAPLRFDYLTRPTTIVPLAIVGALAGLILAGGPGEGYEDSAFTGADAFFATAFSYNAGTHEEAMFRGWLMPAFREYTGDETVANAGSAALFALAHLNTNPQPWPQFALGLYWGWLTQANDWTISEAVFIHTWWDVLVFTALYHYKQAPDAEARLGRLAHLQPVLWLPPLQWAF